jgi:hypothetical protein
MASRGSLNVNMVAETAAAAVPPMAGGLDRSSVPPSVKLPLLVTVPLRLSPLTVPVPPTDVTVPFLVPVIVIVSVDALTDKVIFEPAVNVRVSLRLSEAVFVPSVTLIVASRRLVRLLSPSVQVSADPLPALVTIVGLAV